LRSAEPEGLASVVCVERRDWRAWAVRCVVVVISVCEGGRIDVGSGVWGLRWWCLAYSLVLADVAEFAVRMVV